MFSHFEFEHTIVFATNCKSCSLLINAKGSYDILPFVGLTKLRSNTLYPLSFNSGVYLSTIRLFVTLVIIFLFFDSSRNGSVIATVLPEPEPPTTSTLLFIPVMLQSELYIQSFPLPKITLSVLSIFSD